jgi:uncharacterized protein YjiS (DUF1127 family)
MLAKPMENGMSLPALFDDVEIDVRATPANPVANAFAAAAGAVAAWRAQRARHLAFDDLLGMPPHRLRDLGLSVHDVKEAMKR